MTLRPVSTVAIRGLSTTATSDTVAVDARDTSDRPLGAIVTRIAIAIRGVTAVRGASATLGGSATPGGSATLGGNVTRGAPLVDTTKSRRAVGRRAAMIVVAQSRMTGAVGRVHRGTATTTTMPLRGASATAPKMSVLIGTQMSLRGATSR